MVCLISGARLLPYGGDITLGMLFKFICGVVVSSVCAVNYSFEPRLLVKVVVVVVLLLVVSGV